VVPTDAPLPKLPVARALWVPQPNLKTAAAAWISGWRRASYRLQPGCYGRLIWQDFADMARHGVLADQ